MPTKKETKVWIYLTKRDKSGVRFLSQFRGKEEVSPTRLKDVADLSLPPANTQKLTEIIYEARLEWEPWIESAASFDDIKDKIKRRGYTNIPISFIPEVGSNNITLTPEIYTSNLNKTKIMTRRKV